MVARVIAAECEFMYLGGPARECTTYNSVTSSRTMSVEELVSDEEIGTYEELGRKSGRCRRTDVVVEAY